MHQLKPLAGYIKKVTAEKNLSFSDVQRESGNGIHASYVCRIVNGQIQNPSTPKQKALAKGLGVPVEELLAVVNGAQKINGTTREIAAYVSELPENVQSDLLIIVKSLHQKYRTQK